MLTYKRAKTLLAYDPNTGNFRWRIKPSPWIEAGELAGGLGDGYRVIGVDGRVYKAARLAVLLMTGRWPRHQVDHIRRVRDDDRWQNLREATHSQNAMNKTNARSYALRGASFHKPLGRWRAQIEQRGVKRHLGYFDTAAAAHAAYLTAAARLFGEFTFRE